MRFLVTEISTGEKPARAGGAAENAVARIFLGVTRFAGRRG